MYNESDTPSSSYSDDELLDGESSGTTNIEFIEIKYNFPVKSVIAFFAFKFIVIFIIGIAVVIGTLFNSPGQFSVRTILYVPLVIVFNPLFLFGMFIVPCPFGRLKNYYLFFSQLGISGVVSDWFSPSSLDEAVVGHGRNNASLMPKFTLTKIEDNKFVAWSNFHSFTCHKDCIMLWRESKPCKGKIAQWSIQLGLTLSDSKAPFRVCCSNYDELNKLRSFLAQRLPEVRNFYPELKVIF